MNAAGEKTPRPLFFMARVWRIRAGKAFRSHGGHVTKVKALAQKPALQRTAHGLVRAAASESGRFGKARV
jgi:hypothetical protein